MKPFKIFIVLLLTIVAGFAQDIQIKAYVSNNSPALDEQFRYTLELSGNSTSLPQPGFPDFKNFYVLTGPNTSSSIQIVNGKMSSIKSYSFVLQAKNKGSIKLAPATVTYKGKSYTSNPITLKVGGAASAQKQSTTQPQIKSRKDSEISGQDLYIKTFVSKRKAYLGEQIILTYKLYFRAQVRGYNFEKMPSYAGFWTEEFEMPRQPVIETEMVNGVQYNTAVLRRLAIFPTQTGVLELEPMRVSLEAVVQAKRSRRSLFDSFFDDPFGRTVQKVVTTKPIKITVKSLPAAGKPKDFSGAVGNFKFSAKVDKYEAQVNQAISLKLNLQGSGNIQTVELPAVKIPTDIEQYEPKIASNIKKDGKIISGSKSAELILIPRIPGAYKIKPIRFSFFNPRTLKYETITSKPIQLVIAEGSGGPLISGKGRSGLSRQEVTLLGQDIRFIKEFSEFTPINDKPYLSYYFWGSMVLALIFYLSFLVYDDRLARISNDEGLARKSRAAKLATRQLANAHKHIQDQDKSVFYRSLSSALQGFVQDKLNIELTDFSAQNIERALRDYNIEEDEIKEYKTVLEESDFHQFSGSGSSTEECRSLYERAKTILTRLAKGI